MESYNKDLAARPQIVVATKIDALDDPERLASLKERVVAAGKQFFAISSATGEGVKDLINAVSMKLDELRAGEKADAIELSV